MHDASPKAPIMSNPNGTAILKKLAILRAAKKKNQIR
jgi:hypothetical protein